MSLLQISKHETGIEWTHVPAGVTSPDHLGYRGATWNPVRGCVPISPGCKHCYAKTFAERWRGVAGNAYEQGFDLRLVPQKLREPLSKANPHAYFVNSMSDLHQEGVPHDFLRTAYAVMQASQKHLFMVLTKRADRMQADLAAIRADRGPIEHYHRINGFFVRSHLDQFAKVPPPNVWLGVSVEDRKYGVPRIDTLRNIPAAIRFLSIEPLLEDLGDLNLTGIHWVLVGGESGHGARLFNPKWAYKILAQCKAQGVAFFMKQLGTNAVTDDWFDLPTDQYNHLDSEGMLPSTGYPIKIQTKSRKGGDLLDIPEDLRIRQFPILHQLGASPCP